MAQFFWYQMTGGEDPWVEALSEHRDQILQQRKPAFTTVLDAFSVPDPTWGRDDYAKMKYLGPYYVDFDAESIDETIPEFQKFLNNLKDMGVSLHSLRLYATGGRGFHIEVPMPVFVPKVPKTGITALPYILREMSMELVVDTLDMRVYTGRKGRMWRTPGVERSNGKYKVPISVEDAMAMTPELYDEVCAQPIPEPNRELPELNMALAALFMKSQQKVEEAVKRRAKGNVDEALLAKFKGQFPPTVERILRGEGLAPGVGFHKLALQLAITANALGKTADQLVEAADGLCKTHQSDSARYSSPRKRKEELRRMHEYTRDNPCYGYSRGGIRSLVDVDTPTSDLDGTRESAGVGDVPDNDDDPVDTEAEKEAEAGHASIYEGLLMTKSGIHKRTAEGAKTISNISFVKPTLIYDIDNVAQVVGIEADMRCDGENIGRRSVPLKAFMSRGSLSAYCSDYGGIFSGSDTQAGVVQLMLNRSAKKGGRVVYALHREGLDVVQNPLVKDRSVKDVVWVHPDQVVAENTEANYKYMPKVSTTPTFYSDIHNAKPLEYSDEALEWLKALMQVNSPTTTAQMLGWFVSCFHKQFYQAAFNQFPLLHPNGPAGCGKTQTALLMGRMFHLTTPVVSRSCATSTTSFSLKAAFTGSASVPLVLDEYKPSEMGIVRTDLLLQAFRGAYNQATGSSGGMSKGNAGSSFRDITEYDYSTPICFLAEAQEMQTAIVQRSLPVNFNPDDSKAHTKFFLKAQAGVEFMPLLGARLLRWAMNETVESRREALTPIMQELRSQFPLTVNDRQVYNLAAVIEGLNALDVALRSQFGTALVGHIDTLRQALWDHKEEINEVAMSEAAKMINDLALISRTEEPESEFALREGTEYIVKDGYVEVRMRESFIKYFSWCKRKGFTPLYSNPEAFLKAMKKFPALMDSECANSPLKTSGQTRIFRFSLQKLTEEGVEMFKAKGS